MQVITQQRRWVISFVSFVNVNRPHIMENDKPSGWGGQGTYYFLFFSRSS